MNRWLKGAAMLGGLGVLGFLGAASGIMPIKASSGHWAITEWFLNFSMHRSISTHSMGIEVPPLDGPGLVLKGAGHYQTACRPCHGSPDLQRPRIAQAMLPHPPYLPPVISEWKPQQLFYLVKHGIKLTGMPAWPSQHRDDEVWAMVAFLLKLPELDTAGYRRLVYGEAEAEASGEVPPIQDLVGPEKLPRAVLESCARCHGADGRGRGAGAFPRLAGQNPAYLSAALQAYAQGTRHSGIMEPVAASLGPEEIQALGLYYGGLPPSGPAPAREGAAEAIERGRTIAQQGISAQRVPGCIDCHGPDEIRHNPFYPVLAGQSADYLLLQLELFKKQHRGGSAYAHLMRPVVERLTSEQMWDVARYYESLALGP